MSAETPKVRVVHTRAELALIADRCLRAARVAVDAEANGLYAFRAELCTLQLAFEHEGEAEVVVVDTLAAGVAPLAGVLGPGGPVKVLHDLTFDARLLAEAGAPLQGARDTSVAARFLGLQATGLGAVLASELGVHVDKRFQQHDWRARPLTAEHIDYLAADVRHLLALDAHLEARAAAIDIGDEIADECAYKLVTALGPPRDGRPGYVRIKGAARLDPVGRAVLRRLYLAREAAAEAADVPPFKIVPNEVLLEVAARRPVTREALSAVRGARSGRAGHHVEAWLAAVTEGVRDGDVPEADRALFAPAPPRREVVAKRQRRAGQVSAWRRAEAARRGVDEQAVLPGHCADALVEALLRHDEAIEAVAIEAEIAAIPGLGARRLARYGDALAALAVAGPGAPET